MSPIERSDDDRVEIRHHLTMISRNDLARNDVISCVTTRAWHDDNFRMSRLTDELRFYAAKARQFQTRRVDPRLTAHPEYLNILRRDGIVFVENFIGPENVTEIIEEIQARTDLMTDRLSPNIVKRNARYLLIDPAAHLPSTRMFFNSDVVRGLARAYLSKDAVPDRPAVQLKTDIGEASIVDLYHIDEWRYLLSAFLLLTDVGADEAPMMYLKGSHRPRLWRIRTADATCPPRFADSGNATGMSRSPAQAGRVP